MPEQQSETTIAATNSEADMPDMQSLALRVQRLNQDVDFWNTAMIWALIFAAIAAIAVVVTTRIVLVRAKQLTEAQELLASAKESDNELQLAGLNKEAEALRQNNSALQARLTNLHKQTEARHLTSEQQSRLANLLSSPPNTEGIAIVSPIADGEAADFVDDFNSAFKAAHWDTLIIPNRITNSFGVSVVTTGGVSPERIKRISDALNSIGVSHNVSTFKNGDASTSPAFQSGYLYLVVEHKPLPKAENAQAEISAGRGRGSCV
jgi:hypothetical protein